jgi:hypothetical protein
MPAQKQNATSTLESLRFENHVLSALKTAGRIAEPDPVRATDLLAAVLAEPSSSDAFRRLAELLPLSVTAPKKIKQKIEELTFDADLERGFAIARKYLVGKKMWGRHFIAVALLAADQDALANLTGREDTSLAVLQDAWYAFVTSDPHPTSAQEWKKWWREAEVPLPDERGASEETQIKYWIFQATPERFDLSKGIVASKQDRWLTNQYADEIQKKDIVFFWQSGPERGIFGWGEIVSERAYISDHDSKTSVDVIYRQKLSSPIPFNQIRELTPMKAHPLLGRIPRGTNFKLSYEQTRALIGLIKETPLPPVPPPSPERDFEMKFRPLSDIWTTEDRLGYVFYATAIADTILKRRIIPPISMSIQAPWGQGKTSLMRMIQTRLEAGAVPPSSDAMNPSKTPSPDATPTLGKVFDWYHVEQRKPEVNMLKVNTKGSTAIPTVWFNPLYYHKSDQIWAGMAHAILHQLSQKLGAEGPRFWFLLQLKRLNIEALRKDVRWFVLEKFAPFLIGYLVLTLVMVFIGPEVQNSLAKATKLDFFKALHPAMIPPLLALLHWIGWESFGFKSWKIQDKFERYISEPDYESKQGMLWLVDQDMARALELLVGDNPIAIFIDDLDRCQPEVVSEVIYAINQFMSVTGRQIIFIIGMDSGMVAKALEDHHRHFQGKDNNIGFGWRFLEKFIQVPFVIPRISGPVTRDFMGDFVGDRPSADETETVIAEADQQLTAAGTGDGVGKAVARVEAMPNNARKVAFLEKASKKLQAVLNDPRSDEVNRMVDIAIQELEYNPRSIKRFINTARLLYTVWTGSGRQRGPETDAITLIVHAAHLLLNWPEIMGWLQGLPASQSINQDDVEDKSPSDYDVLNTMALNAADLEGWRDAVRERFGENGTVLVNATFYAFLRRIANSKEHLGAVFGARLF